jgi:hypothetical protein
MAITYSKYVPAEVDLTTDVTAYIDDMLSIIDETEELCSADSVTGYITITDPVKFNSYVKRLSEYLIWFRELVGYPLTQELKQDLSTEQGDINIANYIIDAIVAYEE